MDSQSKTTVAASAPARSATPSRRCMALVPGTTTHLTDELHCLLRKRLRVAGLIALTGSAIFLARSLILPGASTPVEPLGLALHAVVVAILTVLCSLLWSRVPLAVRGLRLIEIGIFGSMGLYFAYLQLRFFHNNQYLQWINDENEEKLFVSLATMGNSLRWFVLLVLYGTFIPNTWRRCASVVGLFVLVPLVLMVVAGNDCPLFGKHLGWSVFNMMGVLGTGSAIAIFGSYRIQELQEEALHAQVRAVPLDP